MARDTCTEKVTVRLPDRQAEALAAAVEAGRYPNKSEAVRAGLRAELGTGECVHCLLDNHGGGDDG